jgi:hypothetical protein
MDLNTAILTGVINGAALLIGVLLYGKYLKWRMNEKIRKSQRGY